MAANCMKCLDARYETESFGCNRCGRRLAGPDFFRGSAGSAIKQPCRECLSEAKKTATRLAQIARGRTPYHLLRDVDPETRRAVCRECGPTHIYSTGSKKGQGWRCGTRSDQLSDEFYDKRTDVVAKHASARWHRIREVRGDEMRGTCTQCGDVPVRWNQSEGYFTCASPTRRRLHADLERRRRRLLQYGLSDLDYERMKAEQGGVCAICGGTGARADSDGELVVDHDHKTGAVRALLCNLCNTGIGALRDDPVILAAAIRYLERHKSADGT